MTLLSASARAALVAAGTIVLDQAVKALVRAQISPGERISVVPGLHLVRARNSGVAFGLFPGGGAVLIAVGALALIALLTYFFSHARQRLAWLPTGLLIGGAAGNLIDRLARGAVTDFIQLPHWPAFNVADIAITVGVVALVFVIEGSAKRAER